MPRRDEIPEPPEATSGPFLQFACLCEKVLQEQDGTLSLIRVVDQVTQTATGVDVPDHMPAFVVNDLKLAISLKAGRARGRYAIKIRPEDPSGARLPTFELPVHFQAGGNQGVNLLSNLQFAVQLEGLYWFDILFVRGGGHEDVLLTRIPLEVMYRPQRLAPSQE